MADEEKEKKPKDEAEPKDTSEPNDKPEPKKSDTGPKKGIDDRITELTEELAGDEDAIVQALIDEGYDIEGDGLTDEDVPEEEGDLSEEDKQYLRDTYGAIFPEDPGYPGTESEAPIAATENISPSSDGSDMPMPSSSGGGNPLAKLLGSLKF
jgi:hypothetical protein